MQETKAPEAVRATVKRQPLEGSGRPGRGSSSQRGRGGQGRAGCDTRRRGRVCRGAVQGVPGACGAPLCRVFPVPVRHVQQSGQQAARGREVQAGGAGGTPTHREQALAPPPAADEEASSSHRQGSWEGHIGSAGKGGGGFWGRGGTVAAHLCRPGRQERRATGLGRASGRNSAPRSPAEALGGPPCPFQCWGLLAHDQMALFSGHIVTWLLSDPLLIKTPVTGSGLAACQCDRSLTAEFGLHTRPILRSWGTP